MKKKEQDCQDFINFNPDLYGVAKIIDRIKEADLLLEGKEKLELKKIGRENENRHKRV